MNEITMYVRTVITIILLKPIINAIMPGEKMSKYINFVMGLVIIILMILPFSKINISDVFDYSYNFEKMNYEDISRQKLKSTFASNLEKELCKKFETDDVKVTVDDQLNIIGISSCKKKMIEEYLGL